MATGNSPSNELVIRVAAKDFKGQHACSIDCGGSVIKIVHTVPDGDTLEIHCASFTNDYMKDALLYLKSTAQAALSQGGQIDTCGVGCHVHEDLIKETLGIDSIKVHPEIDGFVPSFMYLAKTLPLDDLVYPPSESVQKYVMNYVKAMQESWDKMKEHSDNMISWNAPTDNDKTKVNPGDDGCSIEIEMKGDRLSNGHEQGFGPRAPRDDSNSSIEGNSESVHTEKVTRPDSHAKGTKGIVYPTLLIMTGSAGLPIYIKENGQYQIMDLTAVAGRFFLGAGSLLTGSKNFEDLTSLAEKGNSEALNVVGRDIHKKNKDDIYGTGPKELIYFNFGHAVWKDLNDFKKEDLAASLLEMTALSLAQTYQLWALLLDIKTVFFCGSFSSSNQILRDELSKHFAARSMTNPLQRQTDHYFLRAGAYLGCIGCLFMTLRRDA